MAGRHDCLQDGSLHQASKAVQGEALFQTICNHYLLMTCSNCSIIIKWVDEVIADLSPGFREPGRLYDADRGEVQGHGDEGQLLRSGRGESSSVLSFVNLYFTFAQDIQIYHVGMLDNPASF